MLHDFIPDDFLDVVENIVEKRLKYFRSYSGVVMAAPDPLDGSVQIHSVDFGTDVSDPTTWLVCQPGNRFFSAISPQLNDSVEIYFPEGTPDRPRYRALDPYSYISTNQGAGKYVIFELDLFRIVFNSSLQEFEISFGPSALPTAKISLSASAFEVAFGLLNKIFLTAAGVGKIENSIGSLELNAAGQIKASNAAGDITLKPSGEVGFNNDAVTISLAGLIEALADIQALAGLPATKVGLATHTTTGVQAGAGTSGPPTPGS